MRARRTKRVSLGRHKRLCSICRHPEREAIEQDFIDWSSAENIAKKFALPDNTAVYRHAKACSLYIARERNLRGALAKIIERVDHVEISATAIVAAIQCYARINRAGQWVEPGEQFSLSELFQRLTTSELDDYARTGNLPPWFKDLLDKDGHLEPPATMERDL